MAGKSRLFYYNPELKEKYIIELRKTGMTEGALNGYATKLKHFGQFENDKQTEMADFTKEYWEDAWLNLVLEYNAINSPKSLQIFESVVNSYLSILEKTNIYKVKFSNYEKMHDLIVELGVFERAAQKRAESIIGRKELFKNLIWNNKTDNWREEAAIALMYDGVCGSGKKRVLRVRSGKEYIDTNNNTVSIGDIGKAELLKMKVTSETMKVVLKASEQKSFYSTRRNPPIENTGYLLRTSGTGKSGIMKSETLNTAIGNLSKTKGFSKEVNSDILMQSGIINCLLYAEMINNEDMTDNHILHKKLWKYYKGSILKPHALYNHVLTYKAYKMYKKNGFELDFSIVNEMKHILDDVNNIELTNKEIELDIYNTDLYTDTDTNPDTDIGTDYETNPDFDSDTDTDIDIEEAFFEGDLKFRAHYLRERNPSLIKKAKANYLSKHEHLQCYACHCIPFDKYGEYGDSTIEGHHKIPLFEFEEGKKMKVEDIILVCANCHALIHRKRKEIMDIEDLKMLLDKMKFGNVKLA